MGFKEFTVMFIDEIGSIYQNELFYVHVYSEIKRHLTDLRSFFLV